MQGLGLHKTGGVAGEDLSSLTYLFCFPSFLWEDILVKPMKPGSITEF